MMPDQTDILFISLEPDRVLTERILDCKQRAWRVAGDQLFLDHPPHLTVYLAAFTRADAIIGRWPQIAAAVALPRLTLTGWHLFDADALTGRQTLVCEIRDDGQTQLRAIQQQIIQQIAADRDRTRTTERYRPRWPQLSSEQQAAVVRDGFPYVGAGWHPHFTIASIDAPRWPAVRKALWQTPILGEFTCPQLALYRLVDEHPHRLASSNLSLT